MDILGRGRYFLFVLLVGDSFFEVVDIFLSVCRKALAGVCRINGLVVFREVLEQLSTD